MTTVRANRLFSSVLRRIRPDIFDYLVIILCALIPIWKMGLTGIWDFTDAGLPFNQVSAFLTHLYAWNHFVNLGSNVLSTNLVGTPLLFLSALLEVIRTPLVLINRLTLFSSFALAGWGMYYLVKTMFPFEKRFFARLAGLAGALFNMFNPYNIYHLETGGYNFIIIAGMLPLTMAFIYKGFKASQSKAKWIQYSILTAASCVILLTQNEEMTVLLVLFLGVFCLALLIGNLSKLRSLLNNIKFLSVTFIASVGLNLFWLLPELEIYFNTSFVSNIFSNPYFSQMSGIRSGGADILIQSFRLQAYSSNLLAGFVRGNWVTWITSPANVLVGIALCCMAYASLFLRKGRKIAFFAVATALSTGLSIGLAPPLGSIYAWLWNNFIVFRAFSNPALFLQIVQLGYSVLLGVFTAEIARRISSWHLAITGPQRIFKLSFSKIFAIIMIFLILFNAYPILSGNLNGILETFQVPNYYYQTSSWLQNQQGDFRVMMLPEETTGSYTWTPTQPAIYGMSAASFLMFTETPVIDFIPARIQSWVTPTGAPDVAISYYLYNLLMNAYSDYTFNMLYHPGIWADDNFTSGWNFVQKDPGVTSSNFTGLGNMQGAVETVTSTQVAGVWYKKSVSISTDEFPYFIVRFSGNGSSQYVFQLNWNNGGYNSGVQQSPNEPTTLIMQLPPGKTVNTVLLQAKCPWAGTATIHWDFVMFSDSIPPNVGISKMLNLLNIKYLIVSNDLADAVTRQPVDTTTLRDFLGKMSDIKLVECFGALYIYENLNYEDTQIYGSTNYVLGSTNYVLGSTDYTNSNLTHEMDNFFALVTNNQLNITDMVYLLPQSLPPSYYASSTVNLSQSSVVTPEFTGAEDVNLTYKQISPCEYKVNVNADKPFVLVFSETYDNQWSLYTEDGQAVPCHFIANFYANGWYIQKTGNYTLTLYFTPQNYLNMGLYGTAASAIILFAILVLFEAKRMHALKSKKTTTGLKT